ncbi:MAG: hypothetical protein E7631_06975 [Ruminococcaceae bacterium]|nr:hypothetical protein [Oscillospiraceae bacterium]
MNRAEYNDILKNIMGILKNPNGNFGKKFMTGDPETDGEILKNAEMMAAVALIAVDEYYSFLTKAAYEGHVADEI